MLGKAVLAMQVRFRRHLYTMLPKSNAIADHGEVSEQSVPDQDATDSLKSFSRRG